MSPTAARLRYAICADCLTPCSPRPDAGDPCAACGLGHWGQHDCGSPKLPGDRLAAVIEEHVLGPARNYAPAVVAAVEACGGCGHAQHALGSARRHPDADAPIV